MSGTSKTNVTVSRETWKRLNRQKEPGQTFDDIIRGLLNDEHNATESEDTNT